MRGDVVKQKPSGIYKTLATGLVLSLLVMAAAMIYMLYNAQPEGDRTLFILRFALPFGILAVGFGGFGVFSMGKIDQKKWRVILLIISSMAAATEILAGVFGIIFFNNLSIGISLIAIGVCLIGLTITALFSLNDN